MTGKRNQPPFTTPDHGGNDTDNPDEGRDPVPASSPCLLGSDDPGIDPAYNEGFTAPAGLPLQSANTIVYCRRWRETVAFYRQVLALETNHANDWFIEFRLTPGSYLSIANAERSSIEASHGRGLTLALRVADLEAAHRFVCERGAAPTPIKRHGWGARVFYLRDPEGNRLEFWTETP